MATAAIPRSLQAFERLAGVPAAPVPQLKRVDYHGYVQTARNYVDAFGGVEGGGADTLANVACVIKEAIRHCDGQVEHAARRLREEACGTNVYRLIANPATQDTVLSLDAPAGSDEDNTYGEYLAAAEEEPEDRLFRKELMGLFREFVGLNAENPFGKILALRFGIGYSEAFNLIETGELLGISRERVRQRERQALQAFRKFLELRKAI